MYHDDDLLNQVEMERQSIDKQLHKEYLNRASAFLDGSRKFRTWAKEYQWEACEKFQVTYHLLLEFTYPFLNYLKGIKIRAELFFAHLILRFEVYQSTFGNSKVTFFL